VLFAPFVFKGKMRLIKNILFILIGWMIIQASLACRSQKLSTQAEREGLNIRDEAVVTSVYDGDTIRVRFENGKQRKVRLLGVDSPEIGDSREEIRLHAFFAKRFSYSHLYRERIKLSYDENLEDGYGRLLAYVFTEDKFFNKFIIEQGFASALVSFPMREDYKQEFLKAQEEARRKRRGIWAKGDFPSIEAEEAAFHLGEIVSVRFICEEVKRGKNFIYLLAPEGKFEALIPLENVSSFPEVWFLRGKRLEVTGFLEKYKERIQLLLFLKRQIKFEGIYLRPILNPSTKSVFEHLGRRREVMKIGRQKLT